MFVILKGVTFPRQQQFHIFVMKCAFWLQALIMIAVNTLIIIVLLSFLFDLHPFHVFISLEYSYLYSNLLLLLPNLSFPCHSFISFLFLVFLLFLCLSFLIVTFPFFSLSFFLFFVFSFLSLLFFSLFFFHFFIFPFLSYFFLLFLSFLCLSFLIVTFPFRVILSFHWFLLY